MIENLRGLLLKTESLQKTTLLLTGKEATEKYYATLRDTDEEWFMSFANNRRYVVVSLGENGIETRDTWIVNETDEQGNIIRSYRKISSTVNVNGWEKLEYEVLNSTSTEGDGITQKLCNFNISGNEIAKVGKEAVTGTKFIHSENDLNTIEEQIEILDWFQRVTGLELTIVSSGNVSLHYHLRLKSECDAYVSEELAGMLAVLTNGDSSARLVTQACRAPGFTRLRKDNTHSQTVLVCLSEKRYTIEEVREGLNKAWKEKGYTQEFSIARIKEWEKIRKAKKQGISHKALELIEEVDEIFNMPNELFKDLSHKETYQPNVGTTFEGKTGDGLIGILNLEIKPAIERMSLESQYALAGYDNNFQRNGQYLEGRNPFSATNSSGKSFKVFVDSGCWHSFATDESGGVLKYIQLVWYGVSGRQVNGTQFKQFIERLCGLLGLDFKALSQKYQKRNQYELDALEEVKKELKVETVAEVEKVIQTQALEIIVPTIDYKQGSQQSYDNSTLYVTFNNDAQDLAQQLNSPVLNITYNFSGLKEVIEEYSQQSAKKTKVRVLVSNGFVRRPVDMARCKAIYEACDGISGLTLGYVQFTNGVDVSSVKAIKFENIEATYHNFKKQELARQNYQLLSQRSVEANVETCVQYISNIIDRIKPGMVNLIDSPMGTGKTTLMDELVSLTLAGNTKNAVVSEEFKRRWLEHPKVTQLGYRIGLLRQTAMKTGLTFINDSYDEDSDYTDNKGVQACVDSIFKMKNERYEKGFLIFDEIEAIFKHLFTSDTLKKNRSHIMTLTFEAIKTTIETGGTILGLESNITDLTLECLRIAGINDSQINIIHNSFETIKYDCTLLDSKEAVTGKTLSDLESGAKVIIATDTKAYATELFKIYKKELPGKKGLLITSETSDQSNVQLFLSDPKQSVEEEKFDYVIYSPTLESGGDINFEYFDYVAFNFQYLETRAQLQMMNRVRTSIPRIGFVADFGISLPTNRGYSVDMIYEDTIAKIQPGVFGKEKSKSDVLMSFMLGEIKELFTGNGDRTSIECSRMIAKFECRENCSRLNMKEEFVNGLAKKGITLKYGEIPTDDEIRELHKEVKEEIKEEEARELAEADTKEMSLKQAQKILSSQGHTKDKVTTAKKKIKEDKLPGFDFTKENIRTAFVEKRGELYKATDLYFNLENPKKALLEESTSWERMAEDVIKLPSDLRVSYQKVELLRRTGIYELIKSDGEFYAEMEEVDRFAKYCRFNAKEIKRLLGLTVTPKTKPMRLLGDMLGKLGLSLIKTRYPMINGKQTYVYQIDKETEEYAVREALLAAMYLKHQDIVQGHFSQEVTQEQLELMVKPMAETQQICKSHVDNTNKKVSSTYEVQFAALSLEAQKEVLDCHAAMCQATSKAQLSRVRSKYSIEYVNLALGMLSDAENVRLARLISPAA